MMMFVTYADGIDIGLVTRKRLAAHAVANVPQFGRSVASARDKSAEVGRERERHDVARVSSVRSRLRASLYVPQRTSNRNRKIIIIIIIRKILNKNSI